MCKKSRHCLDNIGNFESLNMIISKKYVLIFLDYILLWSNFTGLYNFIQYLTFQKISNRFRKYFF